MKHHKIESETFNTWDKLAEIYWTKFSTLRIYDHTYNGFIDQLPRAYSSILDLGCGPGIISHYLFSQNKKLKLSGVDVSPAMIQKATEMTPGFIGHTMKIQDFYKLDEMYDGIVCGFGFPYLDHQEVETCIETCYSKLNGNGLLYISFVEGTSEIPEIKTGPNGHRIHFYYHQTKVIKDNLEKAGFLILRSWIIPYPGPDHEQQEHVIFLAQKS